MENFWAHTDRTISGIGRLALKKPIISGLFIITAILATTYQNGHLDFMIKSEISPLNFAMISIPVELLENTVSESSLVNNLTPSVQPKAEQETLATVKPNMDAEKINILEGDWKIIRVQRGDNLAKIFKRTHVSAQDLVSIASMKDAKALKKLAVGEQIQVLIDDKHRLQRLVYFNENKTSLVIAKTEQGLKSVPTNVLASSNSKTAAEKDVSLIAKSSSSGIDAEKKSSSSPAIETAPSNYVSGEIHKSLYTDARKAGLTAKQAHELVHIFSSNNIVNKLHPGDQFSVIYEPTIKNISGHILAAQLTTKAKDYRMIRFTDPQGHTDYYTPNGETLRPGISRSPTHYSHISSKFSKRRFHPLLGFVRPHDGVDYAAPTGTPITAAGAGVVTAANYKGGYGKMVAIKHDGKYSTLYAHMSRFAANIKPGVNVIAGQVIGYIGRTGLASGSHLHYEIHVHNKAMDPLTVELPNASIPKAYRSHFLAQSKLLLAQLDTKKPVHLAQNNARVKPS